MTSAYNSRKKKMKKFNKSSRYLSPDRQRMVVDSPWGIACYSGKMMSTTYHGELAGVARNPMHAKMFLEGKTKEFDAGHHEALPLEVTQPIRGNYGNL